MLELRLLNVLSDKCIENILTRSVHGALLLHFIKQNNNFTKWQNKALRGGSQGPAWKLLWSGIPASDRLMTPYPETIGSVEIIVQPQRIYTSSKTCIYWNNTKAAPSTTDDCL